MIFRQLTSTGDWSFGSGLGNYATNQQAIALNIQTAVLMWAGDCFFSLNGANAGFTWVNWKGLLNVGQQNNLNSALQLILSQCFGVMGIVSSSAVVNPTTRQIIVSYVINTVYSQQVQNQIAILSSNVGSA